MNVKELLAELPIPFLTDLYHQVELMYPNAHSTTMDDSELEPVQAGYVLGHYRRGLAETIFKKMATQHRLGVQDFQPDKGGCQHVRVTAGSIILTMSHTLNPRAFPVYSNSREQAAQYNQCLSAQDDMFPINGDSADLNFYAILTHNEKNGEKSTFGNMFLGFPNHEYTGWIECPLDVFDIIEPRKHQTSTYRISAKKPNLKATNKNKHAN